MVGFLEGHGQDLLRIFGRVFKLDLHVALLRGSLISHADFVCEKCAVCIFGRVLLFEDGVRGRVTLANLLIDLQLQFLEVSSLRLGLNDLQRAPMPQWQPLCR